MSIMLLRKILFFVTCDFFFFNDTATTEIYTVSDTLSLHDALPIWLLQPGMFIEAHLVTAVRPKAIVIPEDAVVPVQGTNLVWVVKDGKVAQQPVSLGVRTPGFVEVTSGLEVGTQVVVGGLELLAPGAPVMAKVVERKRP